MNEHSIDFLHSNRCGRCGLLLDGPGDAEEAISINFQAGYFSIFPDGAFVVGRFCQSCLRERLGEWLIVSDTPHDLAPCGAYQQSQVSYADSPIDAPNSIGALAKSPESYLQRLLSVRALLSVILLLQFVMLLGGCATPPSAREGEALSPPRVLVLGIDHVPSDLAAKPLWIVAEDSAALTDYVRTRLAQLGLKIAESEGAAAYRIRVTGTFVSEGKFNIAEMPVGPIFEDATTAWAARSNTNLSIGRAAGLSAINATAAEVSGAGLFSQFGGNIIASIGHAAGFGGSFNELLTGDRRGWCFSDCERFHRSRQRARFDLYLTGPDGVTHRFGRAAEVQQRAFVPAQLVEIALEKTLRVLAPTSNVSAK